MISLLDINDKNFEEKSLQVFRFQANKNLVYAKYLRHINFDTNLVNKIDDIPFLPIEFFKSHKVVSTDKKSSFFFQSSGTTQATRSFHYVYNLDLYQESFLNGFNHFYGNLQDFRILALLPSYHENPHSSLIYMADKMIGLTKKNGSQYITDDGYQILQKEPTKKTILIGVSFALLDLAEKYSLPLKNTIVMETGGMKGKRKEITRKELHTTLCKAFSLQEIHAEYGMSELLSQAYSKGNGIFHCPPWMKILSRPINEPFSSQQTNQNGRLKIIDLANYYSCSFIETADIGKIAKDGSFEIMGRIDNSDIRGCNLLIE